MGRLLGYYNPKMPVYVARKTQQLGYNPDKFIDWFVKFPDLRAGQLKKPEKLGKTALILSIYGIYFWVFYILSALLIALVSPIVGIAAVLISPFVTVGVMYGYTYILWHFKYKSLSREKPKKPGSKSVSKKKS